MIDSEGDNIYSDTVYEENDKNALASLIPVNCYNDALATMLCLASVCETLMIGVSLKANVSSDDNFAINNKGVSTLGDLFQLRQDAIEMSCHCLVFHQSALRKCNKKTSNKKACNSSRKKKKTSKMKVGETDTSLTDENKIDADAEIEDIETNNDHA